ncbi:MAG: hypothetical protein K2X94_02565 [Amoebophilaceae bacterium]|nr:hypothetical protein [Amoebophilaceae bacterium]
MHLYHQAKHKAKCKGIVILTIAEYESNFPNNFSAWYAGVLEVQGCDTTIMHLDKLTDLSSHHPAHLAGIKSTFLATDKVVFIFPEHNAKLPVNLEKLTALLPFFNKQVTYLLITITADDVPNGLLFNYPLTQLDACCGVNLSSNRIQIKNSRDGSMCYLFKEYYHEIESIIKHISREF